MPGGVAERMWEAVRVKDAAFVEVDSLAAAIVRPGDDYPYPIVQGRDASDRVIAVVIDCCELALCDRPDDESVDV